MVAMNKILNHSYSFVLFFFFFYLITGMMTAASVLPLVKATGRKDASFEDLMSNDEDGGFRYDCYNNDRYRRYMEHLFPYFDKLGILD